MVRAPEDLLVIVVASNDVVLAVAVVAAVRRALVLVITAAGTAVGQDLVHAALLSITRVIRASGSGA